MPNETPKDPYAGFPADAPNELVDGYTRLHKAASLDDAGELVRLLALPGCDPNIREMHHGMTPLAEAAYFGAASCVDVLLSHGHVDVETPDIFGRTPLIFAANMGHLTCLQSLAPVANLSHVAGGSISGNALMAAAGGKHTACVKFLAPLINAKATSSDGSTALMHAAEGGILASLRLLLPLSDVHATNDKGQNAFMRAALMDKRRTMLELLPFCDPFLKDAEGADALDLARRAAENRMRDDPNAPLMETAVFLVAYMRALKEMSQIAQASTPQGPPETRRASIKKRL